MVWGVGGTHWGGIALSTRAMQRDEDPSEGSAQEPAHKLRQDTCAGTALFFLLSLPLSFFPVSACACEWPFFAEQLARFRGRRRPVARPFFERAGLSDNYFFRFFFFFPSFCSLLFLKTVNEGLRKKKKKKMCFFFFFLLLSTNLHTRTFIAPNSENLFRKAGLSVLQERRRRYLFGAFSLCQPVRLEPRGSARAHARTQIHTA